MIIKNPNTVRGVFISLIEMMTILVVTIIIKNLYSDDLGNISVMMVLFFRYAGSVPFLLAFAFLRRGRHAFAVTQKKTLVARIIVGALALSCFYGALESLELSKVITLFQTAPLFVILFAPFALGETVGRAHLLAALVGFGGVFFILSPDGQGWLTSGIILAMAAPLFGAAMFLLVRKLGDLDAPITTALWYNIAGALIFWLIVMAQDHTWPSDPRALFWLVVIGVLSAFQQFFLAFSHSLAAASVLALLRYFAVPLSMVADIMFFGASLTGAFLLGSAMIVTAACFVTLRHSK